MSLARRQLPLSFLAAAFLLSLYGIVDDRLRFAGPVAGVLAVVGVLITYRVLPWPKLLVGLMLVILVVPIRRYILPGNLPFQMEPYRLYVALMIGGWSLSLLADRRLRIERTGFEAPLGLLMSVILASEVANGARVDQLASYVTKSLTFFISYLLIVYLLASLLRTERELETIVRVLVAGGAGIAASSIVELRTGFNLFDHLNLVLPFLKTQGPALIERGGHARAFGPAQHPIALGAALVMLLPLSFYVAATSKQRRWLLAAAILLLGSLASLSRTTIVMLLVVVLVFLVLRPRVTWRLWPALIPMLVATHFVLPGALGTFTAYFRPQGGLISNQLQLNVKVDMTNPLWCNAAPRLKRVRPMLSLAADKPLLGYGYGTRITGRDPNANACVLDDEWLGTLLETGALGLFAWWWLIVRFVRRAGRAAKEDTPRGWLLAALAASIAAFAAGMFLFDAFSFIQVTLLFFIFIGLGAVRLRLVPVADAPPAAEVATLPFSFENPMPARAAAASEPESSVPRPSRRWRPRRW